MSDRRPKTPAQPPPDFDDIIVIDGPAAAGKTTIARSLSKLLNYQYLDTGAMYRAVAVRLADLNVGLTADDQLSSALDAMTLDIQFADEGNLIRINGEDYTHRIRTPEASGLSSIASTNIRVREKLVQLQRAIGSAGKVIAEGRDMGTVVFPKAKYKFFLTASLEARSARRFHEETQTGKPPSLEQTQAELSSRDIRDSTRQHSPLKPAPDAVIIDTTQLTIPEVIDLILERITGTE